MKKILIVTIILSFVVIVSAFTIGNNISQQQLDNLDIASLDLSNGFLRDAQNKVVYDCHAENLVKVCQVYGNFTTISPNYGEVDVIDDYRTFYQIQEFKFRAKTYFELKNSHNVTYARQTLKTDLQKQYNEYDRNNKIRIAKYQTTPTYDITDIMNDIEL